MRIAVFCGASRGVEMPYYHAAQDLGHFIADNGYTLVYGGSDYGLMKEISNTVHEKGGEIIGVVPNTSDYAVSENLTYLVNTRDLAERKNTMRDICDIAVALPGGLGTLDEILSMLESQIYGEVEKKKKIVLFNLNDFFTPLMKYIKSLQYEGFISREMDKYIVVVNDIKELEEKWNDIIS